MLILAFAGDFFLLLNSFHTNYSDKIGILLYLPTRFRCFCRTLDVISSPQCSKVCRITGLILASSKVVCAAKILLHSWDRNRPEKIWKQRLFVKMKASALETLYLKYNFSCLHWYEVCTFHKKAIFFFSLSLSSLTFRSSTFAPATNLSCIVGTSTTLVESAVPLEPSIRI